MRIAGIIAEYDPFHNGHAAHIAATRARNGGSATHIVTIISGNFTQRGEPALVSKFHRADMALANGADLVIELPLPWAMAPAESFACGGVAILNALGRVDTLSFGSECGDVPTLQRLAALSADPLYQTALRDALVTGVPYAAAGQTAAAQLLGENTAMHLASPNNTLAVEYIRATTTQKADFDFYTLQRQGALHDDNVPNQGFASASLLRRMVRDGDATSIAAYMPAESYRLFNDALSAGHITTHTEILEHALLAQLRRMKEHQLHALPWLSEGVENRLYRAIRSSASYSALLNGAKTRRYPMARIRRILWAALIGMTEADTVGTPPYIRVLGMNKRGREILNAASPSLPILTRTAQLQHMDARSQRLFQLECTATDLHTLCMEQPLPCGTDHTQKMILR